MNKMKTVRGLQKQISKLSRVKLANLPTPMEEMPRLSKALDGPRLLVKRDHYTGLAFRGNNPRKLEFVMADTIRFVAQTEGILLAPPHTSVSMACLIDRVKRKQFDKKRDRVVHSHCRTPDRIRV